MNISITGLYAGVLGLVMLFLAHLVSGQRVKNRIPVGTGESVELLDAVRRHANFVEWVPLALILMAICENNGMNERWLHGVGATLTVARLIHPFGVKHGVMFQPLRALGAGVTFLLVLGLSVTSIAQWWG